MNPLADTQTTAYRIGPRRLKAVLTVPESAAALVLFAHGSDSSCVSPRNTRIASRLNRDGIATLLFDFLTEAEARERDNSFKTDLIAERLQDAIGWAQQQESIGTLPIGLFGSGAGMAAVIVVAATRPAEIKAIVGRGGRTDLASDWLDRVSAPTLLVVGQWDKLVLEANQIASQRVAGESRLEIVPGASHLFSEAGKLDEVAELASAWFKSHLNRTAPSSEPR